MSRSVGRIVRNHRQVPSRLDWSNLERAIHSSGNDNDSRCIRFQRLILEKLFDTPRETADDFITDGGDDCGIDCFVIHEANAQIHLVSTKTIESYENAHKNFPGAEIVKLVSFVRDFLSRSDSLLVRCNPILRAKVLESWERMDGGVVFKICVHVCSNQSDLVDRDFNSLQTTLAELRCSAFQHHLSDLSEKISRNWNPPVSKVMRFLGGQIIEHRSDIVGEAFPTRSLMGYANLRDFADFLRDDRSNLVDENLFHANVRGHLGILNPVNKDISRSLAKDENHHFFCLNNGITIVCEKYLYQSGGFPITLHRPQIVNGRQTAEAIFDAYKQDPAGTANAVVAARIIETSDPALIEEISIATNNQSRIGNRDLRANSSLAKKLASGLNSLGYYYARKRGERSDKPFDLTIDALRAGQLILAYLRGRPEKAKTDTSSMFGENFEDVFNPEDVSPEILVTAHRLFTDIEKLKRSAMIGMRTSGLSATSTEHWLVEGAFHALYAVSLFARIRGVSLSKYEECAPLLPEAISTVGGYYLGMNIAAYRLFRSVRSRDELRDLITKGLPVPEIGNSQLVLNL